MIHAAPTFTDATSRRDWFIEACRLVGGQRAMAAALYVTERSVGRWCAGERPVPDGAVADAVAALRGHGNACFEQADLSPP